jgi:hypothetical protein
MLPVARSRAFPSLGAPLRSQRLPHLESRRGVILCLFRGLPPQVSSATKYLRINTSITPRISIKTSDFNYPTINTYKTAIPLQKTKDFKSTIINTYAFPHRNPFRIRTSKKEGGGGPPNFTNTCDLPHCNAGDSGTPCACLTRFRPTNVGANRRTLMIDAEVQLRIANLNRCLESLEAK